MRIRGLFVSFCHSFCIYFQFYVLKGHWTTSASFPIFFFSIKLIRSVHQFSDSMLNLTCSFISVTKMYVFLPATVMTAEFGTIHYFSRLEEYSETCFCSSLDRPALELVENYVNCVTFRLKIIMFLTATLIQISLIPILYMFNKD